MLTRVTHVQHTALFRRARVLPVDGKILVHIGQRVRASDVVAEAVLAPTHIQLDLKGVVGMVPPGKARKMIQRRVGEHVNPGDIIACSGGLFERVLRTPQAGIIDYLSADIVMIQVQVPNYQLMAGIPGEIVEIIPDRGVIIETNAMRVQGAWGNDKINSGRLMMITDSADEEVTMANIIRGAEGEVLVGGFCGKSSVLKSISTMDVHGLVLGSMSASLCELAKNLSFPVVLVDGFGNSPMNQRAYKILKNNEGRELSVMASQPDSLTGERPELIVKGDSEGEISSDTVMLSSGQVVRILGYPYFGFTGVVQHIQENMERLPGGLRSHVCEIKLDDGQVIMVPAINLDVLQ